MHILGTEQVGSCQLCPLALPSVAPQEQVFGVVQVAVLKLCMCGGSVGGEEGSVVGCVVGAPDVSIGAEVGSGEVFVCVSV